MIQNLTNREKLLKINKKILIVTFLYLLDDSNFRGRQNINIATHKDANRIIILVQEFHCLVRKSHFYDPKQNSDEKNNTDTNM